MPTITFHDFADMAGVVNGTSSGVVDLTLSGLNPEKTYTFAGSAARNALVLPIPPTQLGIRHSSFRALTRPLTPAHLA